MKTLLLFLSIVSIASSSSCPEGFDLVSQGQCRGLVTTLDLYWDERAVNTAIEKCNEIDAEPVIIHNAEQQAYWQERGWLAIALVCPNGKTQWQWTDRSPIDYKPPSYHPALDQQCKGGCTWDIKEDGYWNFVCNGQETFTTKIYCTTQLAQPAPFPDGCESFEDDSDDGTCYQIGKVAESWPDAQKICRNFGANLASIHNEKENSFVRRLAVSKGAVNGLFLGAAVTGNDMHFNWIDWTNWDYTNFYPGFPMANLGDCLAMDTSSPTGQWVNVPCLSTQAVACQRKQHYTTPGCNPGPFIEGDIIYSPGFPESASVPCDFILSVDVGKRVQVEILLLEANSCCDRLVISENYIGGTVIAELTGEVNDRTYTTKSSNFMRVSWQPQGGVNVRGMMMTYRGV